MTTIALTPEHRSYLRRETLTGCIFNAVLSVVFAMLIFHGMTRIPLWGEQGIALDLVPTVFMITLVGNLIVTFICRKRVREGMVAPLSTPRPSWLPRRALPRMLLLAVAATVLIVPLSVGVLLLLGVQTMDFGSFVVFKVVYGTAVGALSAPMVIRAALAD